jgi:hypothetical protein
MRTLLPAVGTIDMGYVNMSRGLMFERVRMVPVNGGIAAVL